MRTRQSSADILAMLIVLAILRGPNVIAAPTEASGENSSGQEFLSRNTEVPFCYLPGGTRSWQILRRPLASSDKVQLSAMAGGKNEATGTDIEVSGVTVKVNSEGRLVVDAEGLQQSPAFDLTVRIVESPGNILTQTLSIRPAPPRRPISYIADLVDDLINTFADPTNDTFRTIDRDGFDQYFRRLQAQGISRLIVWPGPFPYFTDSSDHRSEDWSLYERQARAIVGCYEGKFGGVSGGKSPIAYHFALSQGKLANWTWVARLLAARLDPQFGKMFTESAKEHGIALTASFRPFESALTKYYEVPVFDHEGNYLWGFLPMAAPIVNYHADEVGFAHYRTILTDAGQKDAAEPASIELTSKGNAVEIARAYNAGELALEIEASKYPPIDLSSLILVRDPNGHFSLRRFEEIADKAKTKRITLDGFRVEAVDSDVLRIDELSVPDESRYLIVRNPVQDGDLLTASNVSARSKAGTPLGRLNWYWSLSDAVDPNHSTQLAGISEDGEFRSTFQATSSSIDLLRDNPPREKFAGANLVIDLGRPWESEMLDFEQPAARQMAVTQLKRLLSYPAFDEIFINTRTHTQLPGCMGDGADGIRPQREYMANHEPFFHLGVDRAYAPRSLAKNSRIQQLAADAKTVSAITDWRAGEWQAPCESDQTPYTWRLERKRATANGIRMLLKEIEHEFPGVRVRVVVPPTDSTVETVRTDLNRLPKEGGGVYGRDYYNNIWASINHIPSVGESMSMTDFSGLSVEPVFLGIRFTPDDAPLNCYLGHAFRDLSANRGSRFRGPRSFFYEAQETLRGDANDQARQRKRREAIICQLLAHREDVNEVLLYEAADWAYMLPTSDPDLCGHNFVDRCDVQGSADGKPN